MFGKQSTLPTLGAILAAALLAQGPSVQNRVDRLATLLSLTDAQKAKATTIFTDALTAGEPIQSSLHDNRQSLADAVKKNDTATISTLAATAGSLSGQLTAINAKADAAFYAILTADQQAKYDTLPHGGPGGGPGFTPGRFGPPRQ
jgi:Spy/CpxP family protein refolding chaperone